GETDSASNYIVGSQSSNPFLYNVARGQNYVPITSLPSTSGRTYLVSGDINGDELTDIGEVISPGGFVFALQDAAGEYPTATTIPTIGPGAGESLLVDMNGDGRPDLVTLSEFSGSDTPLVVALNTGVGPSWFEPAALQQAFPLAGD